MLVIRSCYNLKLPLLLILQYYGLTETCAAVTMENPRVGSPHSGSTGFLVSGIEGRIMDVDSLKPLPPHQKGEIWIRGPIVMKGGFGNELLS